VSIELQFEGTDIYFKAEQTEEYGFKTTISRKSPRDNPNVSLLVGPPPGGRSWTWIGRQSRDAGFDT
jgi:hypothetical protein